MTLLHFSTWNQDRQRVVAGLVSPMQCQRDNQEKCILCVPSKELSAKPLSQQRGILMGWQRAEGWSECPPAALGLLALRQPQTAHSVQEVGWWGCTEGALGQH